MGSVPSMPIRYGKDFKQATPTTSDLWLPQYGGEILTAFPELNIASNFVRMRSIGPGDTLEFPRLDKMSAERHEAGTQMLGLDIESGKQSISVDARPLVSHFDMDDIDALMSHFETRSEISMAAARALALQFDQNTFQLCVNASRTAADGNSSFLGGGYDGAGTAHTSSALPTTSTAAWTRANVVELLSMIEDILVRMDEIDAPRENRNVAVPWACWHKIKNLGFPEAASEVPGANLIFGNTAGDFGPSAATAGLPQLPARQMPIPYNGVMIYGTNNLPNGSTNLTGESKYQGTFTDTRAVFTQQQAVGVVTLFGMKVATERDERRGTDFTVAKMQYGGGALRPELAVEISYTA